MKLSWVEQIDSFSLAIPKFKKTFSSLHISRTYHFQTSLYINSFNHSMVM